MTTPHRKPTPRKATRIKARRMYIHHMSHSGDLTLHPSTAWGFALPVAVIDVSDEAALIEQAADAIHSDDELNWSYVERAIRVLESLGIIKRKHLPAIHAKRGKKAKSTSANL